MIVIRTAWLPVLLLCTRESVSPMGATQPQHFRSLTKQRPGRLVRIWSDLNTFLIISLMEIVTPGQLLWALSSSYAIPKSRQVTGCYRNPRRPRKRAGMFSPGWFPKVQTTIDVGSLSSQHNGCFGSLPGKRRVKQRLFQPVMGAYRGRANCQ